MNNRKKYYVEPHIKSFIKKEIMMYDIYLNCRKERELEIWHPTREIGEPSKTNLTSDETSQKAIKFAEDVLWVKYNQKIMRIERVRDNLREDEKYCFEKIFKFGHSQVYAEMHDNISKDTYYNFIDKVVYLVSKEYGV